MRRILGLLPAIAAGLVLLGGCGRLPKAGKLQTESQSIDRGAAKTVRAEIRMGTGTLGLSGGAGHLMDASFIYNFADWKPEVAYKVDGDRGVLSVQQPSTNLSGVWHTGMRYEWTIRLADDVPMDLSVSMGAGRSDVKVAGLALNSLDVQAGVGQARVDLRGNWQHDAQVKIAGGVGQGEIILPKGVGVRAKVEGGLGSVHTSDLRRDGDYYVNDAYGKSPVTLFVDVAGGVGEIELRSAD